MVEHKLPGRPITRLVVEVDDEIMEKIYSYMRKMKTNQFKTAFVAMVKEVCP